uniref:OCEL domain-containing protein n=1 Tax=Ursus maritimus TaxID=29073 RepID=A0A452U604_URSMA
EPQKTHEQERKAKKTCGSEKVNHRLQTHNKQVWSCWTRTCASKLDPGAPGWLSQASTLGSGRDPRVVGWSPALGCQEACFSRSLSLSPCVCSLSRCLCLSLCQINKIFKKTKNTKVDPLPLRLGPAPSPPTPPDLPRPRLALWNDPTSWVQPLKLMHNLDSGTSPAADPGSETRTLGQKEAQFAARVWREFEKKQMDPSFLDKQTRCHYLKGKLRHLKMQIQKFNEQGDCEGSVYF